MSFDEVVPRGLELIINDYPPRKTTQGTWAPPAPESLGFRPLTDAELKSLAQDKEPQL